MLCSHTKKFIYLKTVKTAGTSVEIFFEEFCHPPETYEEQHYRPQHISDVGIIGARGNIVQKDRAFYNHMLASEVKFLLGDDTWNSYYKFCVIRNPFDKIVSKFWMDQPQEVKDMLLDSPFQKTREIFKDYCLVQKNIFSDRHIYTINEKIEVDFFIRYETLLKDINHVCNVLQIEKSTEKLGFYKNNHRARKEHYSGYYDEATKKAVEEVCVWELNQFGYVFEHSS